VEKGLIEVNLSKSPPPNRISLEKIIAIMMKVEILIMHSLIKLMMMIRKGCQMMMLKIRRIPTLRILVSRRDPRNQLRVVRLGSRMMARKVGRRAMHRGSLPKQRLVRGVLGGLTGRRASKSRWTRGRSLRKLRRRQEIQGSLMLQTQINQEKMSRLMMEPQETIKVGCKKAENLMLLTQTNQGKMPRQMMEPQETLIVGCKKAESLIIGQAIRDLQGRGLLTIETQQEVDLNNRGIKMEREWIQTLPERDLIPTQITQLHLLPLHLLMPSGLQAR
jgi:hypothetical protein